jgi:hypothetical protein
VINSLDGNGIYGVLVELTGASCGGSCGTTTTDLNGDFIFSGLSDGDYTIIETNLPGYTGQIDSASPPDDDQIPLNLSGSNSTGHLFTDTPSTCTAPTVLSTDPVNGASGISLSTTTLTVTFDQPMSTEGGGSVLDRGNFDNKIDNLESGYGDVDILAVSYDPNTYTATLTIDTNDEDWVPGSQFELKIKNNLENPCGVVIGGSDVSVYFTTDLVISGQVRNDIDGDGNLLDPDSGISGVTIRLYDNTETIILDTTTTNAGGFFTFNNVSPGTYVLREIDPDDYDSTADSDPPNDNRITVNLAVGANSIGHKFLDEND